MLFLICPLAILESPPVKVKLGQAPDDLRCEEGKDQYIEHGVQGPFHYQGAHGEEKPKEKDIVGISRGFQFNRLIPFVREGRHIFLGSNRIDDTKKDVGDNIDYDLHRDQK